MEKDDKSNPDGSGWQRYFQPIVLLLLSSLIALQIPLESKRPTLEKETPASTGIQLDARLWMDPFDAPRRESTAERRRNTTPKDFGGQIIRHVVRQREANPEKPGRAELVFLPVLVDGGPYAESVERRRRVRYAVISGLLAGRYVPEDWDHIRYIFFPDKWRLYDPQDTRRVLSYAERQMPDIIPYEWFEHPNAPDTVVLWLDENQLGVKPLTKLRILRNQFRLNALSALIGRDCNNKPLGSILAHWLENPDRPIKPDCTGGKQRPTQDAGKDKLGRPPLDSQALAPTPNRVLEALLPQWHRKLKDETAGEEDAKTVAAEDLIQALRAPPKKRKARRGAERILTQETMLLQRLGPEKSGQLAWALSEKLRQYGTPEAIAVADARYHVRVIGPSSSDLLAAMLNDDPIDPPRNQAALSQPEVFSPTASIPAYDLLRSEVSSRGDSECEKTPLPDDQAEVCLIARFQKKQGIRLKRTNLADDRLAMALRSELALRDIDLSANENQRIALIAERDTLYGRSSTEVLTRTLNPDGRRHAVLTFTYFRGLDGEGAKKGSPNSGGSNKGGSGNADVKGLDTLVQNVKPKTFDFAWGDDQIDYLRRLSEEIERIGQSDSTDGPAPSIRAIGLVGSDVYDKLLILRALRPRFPSAVFFTTELDARFFDGSVESDIARNLVVASSYGLRPTDATDTFMPPPFRSAEQAAYFRTVRQILPGDPEAVPENNPFDPGASNGTPSKVSLFEIGRTRAIALNSSNHSSRNARHGWIRIAGLLALIAGLLWCTARHLRCPWLTSNWNRILTVALVFLGFGGLLYGLASFSDEPLIDPFEGVSTWPTEFLRLLAALTAVWFWTSASQTRREAAIHGELASLQADRIRNGDNPEPEPGIWRFLATQLPLVGCLAAFTAAGLMLAALGGTWLYLLPFLPFGPLAIAAWLANRQARHHKPGANGAQHDRRTRIHLYALLIFAVCSGLMSLSGPIPPAPTRGPLNLAVDRTLLVVTVSLFIGLLATILESGFRLALWLGQQRKAQKGLLTTPTCPREPPDDIPGAKPITDAPALIEAIGRSTHAFFHIALYPFIIAGLMLISRSPVFDNWTMPFGLAMIFLLCFTLLIACVSRIRTVADQIRAIVVDQLDDPKPLERVRRCKEGAYGSALSGPTLGGLAILAGSGGLPDLVSKLTKLLFG